MSWDKRRQDYNPNEIDEWVFIVFIVLFCIVIFIGFFLT